MLDILLPTAACLVALWAISLYFGDVLDKVIWDDLCKGIEEDFHQIIKLEGEIEKLSSISATMYGQIVEREEENRVDTDTEQTTDNKQ